MQKTKNTPTTKNYTITLTKEDGKLWILKDIQPFFNPLNKSFQQYYFEDMGHDIGKLMACGCTNYVLDVLAGEEKEMDIELRIASERIELPGFVEFELKVPYKLSAMYHVNNCPDNPQLEAWVNASLKQIFRQYPIFAYIKKK